MAPLVWLQVLKISFLILRLFFLTTLFLVRVSWLFGQEQPTLLLDLEDRWAAYQLAVAQQQFAKMTSFLYPPLLRVVAKEDIQKACQRSAYHPDLILQTLAAPLPRNTRLLWEGEDAYASIPYLRILQISFQPEAKEDAAYVAAVVAQYKQEHGAEKVCFEEEEKILRLSLPRQAVAIYSSRDMVWYFIELPEGLDTTLSAFLPAAVYKRLL